jgi:hypothetical protein
MIRIKYGLNQQEIKEVEIQPHMVEGLTKKNKKRSEQKKNNPKHQKESPRGVPTPSKKEKVWKHQEEAPKSTTIPPKKNKWCGGPRRRTHPYPLPRVRISLHQANNEGVRSPVHRTLNHGPSPKVIDSYPFFIFIL